MQGEFAEDGTETHFKVGTEDAYILTTPSEDSKEMEYILFLNDEEVLPSEDDRGNGQKIKWAGLPTRPSS